MRWLIGLVGVAACGRLGFDPVSTPGAGSDASSGGPMIVQVQSLYTTNVATTVLPIVATRPSDLLVVLTADVLDQSPLSTITDGAGDAYASANATFISGSGYGEAWYAPSGAGGATALTITDSANHDREVWFLEISGASTLDTANQVSDQTYGTTITAPTVSPTHVPTMIISFVKLTGTVQSVSPAFTALPALSGDDAVFATVAVAGSYGPTYTIDMSGTYGAATLAFYAP